MVYIPDDFLTRCLQEDVPYFDLTTYALEIGDSWGEISFTTRHPTVICCTEEVVRIMEKLGINVTLVTKTGTDLDTGITFLRGEGNATALQMGWKVSQNFLEYACGVATKTHQLVKLAQEINPFITLYTTRKTIPGTKAIALKAILAGGAFPHRLGLSETVLIFPEHLNFLGGIPGLIEKLPSLKPQLKEKKIVVEIKSITDALPLAKAGIDILQFDKVTFNLLAEIIPQVKEINKEIKILAAGGIKENNIQEYVKVGVDGIVLTAPYFAKPADIQVKLLPYHNS